VSAADSSAPTGIGPVDQALGALPIDSAVIEQHPEILPGVAFAGAFVLARILKRLTE
jgi:hypothetical protein